MDRTLRFAAVQMNSQGDLQANLAVVRTRVEEAAKAGAEVVLLPENFAYFGDEEGKRGVAEDLDAGGVMIDTLRDVARASRVTLIGGGMPERSSDPARPYNTCVVVDAEGTLVTRYRKLHMFDVDLPDGTRYRESDATASGNQAVVVNVGGATIGLSICYDLRFPELYRALSTKGAEVIVVPAAFTLATGKDHWHVLLRARAIEAQAYVVAAAQWGKHSRGRMTFGKSCVVDPWGEIIAQASEGEGIVSAALEPAHLNRVRALVPSLCHRRQFE